MSPKLRTKHSSELQTLELKDMDKKLKQGYLFAKHITTPIDS